MAHAEILPDGKNKYRLVRHSQEEYRGGVHNTHLRKASYKQCEERVKLWREQGIVK